MRRFAYNNRDNPHEEVARVEQVIRSHIGWAVNDKDRETLLSTVVSNDELFFFQPDSDGTVAGIRGLLSLVDDVFMSDDFKAIRTEIRDLRIQVSTTLNTSWFSCLLDDHNELKGEPMVWEDVRWTGVLEKVDGQWKIFQMHFSRAEDQIG